VLGLAPLAPAQDDANALIEKAIKAHGGAEKLAKMKALKIKTKGVLEIMGASLPFTQESSIQLPDKIKDAMQLEVMGQQITVTTVFDGTKGWINANGTTMEMNEDIMEAMKQAVYMMSMHGLTA